MWVCAQNEPATTIGISATASSHNTDHAHSSTTIHSRSGRYGFHGWVSRSWPYPRITTASRAPMATIPRQPARRWPIHSAVAIAARWIATVADSSAHDDEPNSRYVGARR